jgi:hypothetical protein
VGGSKDGVLGVRPPNTGLGVDSDDVLGIGDLPGPIGIDEPIPLDTARIIAKVNKDWDPPRPNGDPEIIVRGATLEQAGRDLDTMDEWGQAGGSIRAEKIEAGTSTNLTIELHAGLIYKLPTWLGYQNASAAAKAEWDRMLAKLKAHEDRHLEIAIEEANKVASELIGKDIAEIARRVTSANRRMAQRQKKLDDDTNHGAKPSVQYGDVILDITIK